MEDIGVAASQHTFEPLLHLVFFCVHPFASTARVRLAVRRLPGVVLWPAIVLGWILAIAVSQGSSTKSVYFDF